MEDNDTIKGLVKKYLWWTLKTSAKEKDEARTFEDKSTFISMQKTTLAGECIIPRIQE
jgi:hypothetical protein